ncbi:hypothetical protein F441_22450 [Phytophthora nicotianae CJ01A1]|uniref:Uncharacterized protein n=2 Tax=Phytophthora nicotianae TaxID=4792 RepID=V9DUG2_PHYNI|nr:hypothetical protein F443_22928 [Phytophthora nicotianae P1569]ETP00128.1 hypothetical protein F441_22450 [Phytophthora nicotianae CJ01A1]
MKDRYILELLKSETSNQNEKILIIEPIEFGVAALRA